jgi:Xaa-Pro aminopeptidase
MITKAEYAQRRQTLATQMKQGSIAIIPSSIEQLRNGDAHYRFRQDSDFHYLTGFDEPDAILVVIATTPVQSILFNRPKNETQEQWSGYRLGQADAPDALLINQAFPIESWPTELPKLLSQSDIVYLDVGRHTHLLSMVSGIFMTLKQQVRRGVKAPSKLFDLEPLLSEMRLFKSPGEIALMRKAAQLSVDAHLSVMRQVKNANFEYELEATFIHALTQKGCRNVAYDSIVAAGANACTLHYTDNNAPILKDALVLIDAGGEYQNYAADITRTFPANGRFNPEQKAIYELVLKAQQAGIACIKPGIPWGFIQETIVQILTTGLIDLGLLKGEPAELIQSSAYTQFYMHNSGHWLGLDVHDCGRYKINHTWRPLEPGMVLTVEPGLYISEKSKGIDSRWLGIGVRIEDDILVTEGGCENLTGALPVSVQAIEDIICGS